jgi:DnaJ-class molecular chaperone
MSEIKWRDLPSTPSNAAPQRPRWRELPRSLSLYDVLQVSPKASPEVIKAAYRALMEKYHPDKHGEPLRQWAEEVSRQLNAAYAVLGNPQKRSDYDRNNGIAGRN